MRKRNLGACKFCGAALRHRAKYGVCGHNKCRYRAGLKSTIRSLSDARRGRDPLEYADKKASRCKEYQRRAELGLPLFTPALPTD